MSRFFFRLDGGALLDYLSVIYFIFRMGPGVGVGVGSGVGVGTDPPRLRTPNEKTHAKHRENFAKVEKVF